MTSPPPGKKLRLDYHLHPSETNKDRVIHENKTNNNDNPNDIDKHKSDNEFDQESNRDNEDEYDHDMVLSEVHIHPQNGSADGRLLTSVFPLSFNARTETQERADEVEDGNQGTDQSWDHAVEIQHAMGTSLRDVGAQVWMGSFLLIDWFMTLTRECEGSVVLELGCGTGLASIACSVLTHVEKFFCTDFDTTVLLNCRQNIERNLGLQDNDDDGDQSRDKNGQIICRRLNWLMDNPLDPEEEESDEFSWSQKDRDLWKTKGAFIIAADVVYDDSLTDALIACLERLLQEPLPESHPRHSVGRVAYVTMEKRYNFSLDQLAVVAQAYEYFVRKVGESSIIEANLVDAAALGQHCDYDRTNDLQLFVVQTKSRSTSDP